MVPGEAYMGSGNQERNLKVIEEGSGRINIGEKSWNR